MASIVKELDKVSGTTTRSHNIADAVSKLKMGGGSGGGAEFVKLIENANLSFGQNQSYAGGGKGFVGGKTFGELIGNKTVIGFICTELTRTDGTEGVVEVFLADFMVTALGTGATYGSNLINQNTDAVRNTTGGSYVCTRTAVNDSFYGTIDVYAICI